MTGVQTCALPISADVVPGDSYRLSREAAARQLSIWDGPSGAEVADGSGVGQPGDRVLLEVCHSMMAPGGTLVELLVLTVTGETDTARVFLPLAPMEPRGEYELVASQTEMAARRLADIASVSFIAGTRLTMANGRQTPVFAAIDGQLAALLGVADPVKPTSRAVIGRASCRERVCQYV